MVPEVGFNLEFTVSESMKTEQRRGVAAGTDEGLQLNLQPGGKGGAGGNDANPSKLQNPSSVIYSSQQGHISNGSQGVLPAGK